MITLAELIVKLPEAVEWVKKMEAIGRMKGTMLNIDYLRMARWAGVEDLLWTTTLQVEEIKFPKNFQPLVEGLFPGKLSAITFGHCIFWTNDWSVIPHELKHVAQYEKLGGVEPFLRQYLSECIRLGYNKSPLELEAIAFGELAKKEAERRKKENEKIDKKKEAVRIPVF